MKLMTRIELVAAGFARHGRVPLVAAILLVGVFAVPTEGRRFQGESARDDGKAKSDARAVEARFCDNSVLKMKVRDERIDILTPYGKLQIPIADIQKIEFATRLSAEDEKRIPVLIRDLGSPDFPARDAASTELLKLAEKAYPALVEAAKSKDPEVVRRANELVEKIADAVPRENLEVRPNDVIQTADSRITGKITASTLKVMTTQFGEVTVKLLDMHSLHAEGYTEPEKEVPVAEAAPPSLQHLQNQIGKTFSFTVTGAAGNGNVWGTNVYTLDSFLPAAAVHAGVLKVGQTGVVKIKILPALPAFTGSNRNGVVSSDFGPFPGAFQILKK
jgi:hypothetical protein